MEHTIRVCRKCGRTNRMGARFCSYCGDSFTGEKWERVVVTKMGGQQEMFPVGKDGRYPKLVGKRKNYKLGGLIHADKFGNIHRAKEITSGKDVVYKKDIEPPQEDDKLIHFRNLFIKSADRQKEISHIHVPRLFEAFYDDGYYTVVLEYIEGIPLELSLANMPDGLSVEFCIKCFVAICKILEFMHKQDPPIYHLDIKPSKVLLNQKDQLFLLPWVYRPGKHGDLLGTRGFASPEQYRGEFDQRSDVYGLAAFFHYILTGNDPRGEPPFHFLPISAFKPKLKGELEMIIKYALNLKPGDRFHSVRDFRLAAMEASVNLL